MVSKLKQACSVKDCEGAVSARGLCGKHYQRLYYHGDENYVAAPLIMPECSEPGCTLRAQAGTAGICRKHSRKAFKNKLPPKTLRGDRCCSVEGCESRVKAKDLCSKHYQRMMLRGTTDPSRGKVRGRTCEIEGCSDEVYAVGICSRHYQLEYQRRYRKNHERKVRLPEK